MNQEPMVIYQSGQKVLITGLYEAAGAPEATYTLLTSDLFPDYNGRAVCWHLINEIATSQPSVNTPYTVLPQAKASEPATDR